MSTSEKTKAFKKLHPDRPTVGIEWIYFGEGFEAGAQSIASRTASVAERDIAEKAWDAAVKVMQDALDKHGFHLTAPKESKQNYLSRLQSSPVEQQPEWMKYFDMPLWDAIKNHKEVNKESDERPEM